MADVQVMCLHFSFQKHLCNLGIEQRFHVVMYKDQGLEWHTQRMQFPSLMLV
jgi:3-mercaptopyruvate sulfurtransferase SseA